MHCLYLGGHVDASADIMPEIKNGSATRMSMLQSVKREALRYGGCRFHSQGSPANDRGGGDLAIRVCDLDSRPGAPLSSERHTITSSYGSLASSADNTLNSCRTPRLSRTKYFRRPGRSSANDAFSLREPYKGRPTSD